jgi:hypothetical protein
MMGIGYPPTRRQVWESVGLGCAGGEDTETLTAGTGLSLLKASETASAWKSRRLVIHRTALPMAANH